MTILITNDDGDSAGLRMLIEAAKSLNKKVLTLVPNRQRSAIARALTLHKPLRLHKIEDEIYSLNGTPADCVLFATHSGEFEKPELVLSGINWADNAGMGPLIGSGTVGACWQAAHEGIPSIAFSLYREGHDWRDADNWGNPKPVIKTVEKVLDELIPKLSPDKFFNVNIPEDPEKADIVYTKNIQRRRYKTIVEKRTDPRETPYFWVSGGKRSIEEGTDVHELIANKNITICEVDLLKVVK